MATAEDLGGVDPLAVYRLGGALTVFRITTIDLYEPELVDSFRSNYELEREPRRRERESTPIHMGVSVYLSLEQARDTARRWPRLGAFVARLELLPPSAASFALTSFPGHLTVWGRAADLVGAVVSIVPVEE